MNTGQTNSVAGSGRPCAAPHQPSDGTDATPSSALPDSHLGTTITSLLHLVETVAPKQDRRFAEVGCYHDGDQLIWSVNLWESSEADSSKAEQEFIHVSHPDLLRYVEAWVRDGKVIF